MPSRSSAVSETSSARWNWRRALGFTRSGGRTRLAVFAGFAALLAVAFLKPLVDLAAYAAQSDLHSHVLLIPFVSAYLLFVQRGQLPTVYDTSPKWALLAAAPALAALIAAWALLRAGSALSHNDYLSLMAFSFVCFLVVGGFAFLGFRWMAAAAFPMAFLIFMVPLPDRALDFLETVSQAASAEAAALFFAATGVPMLRHGALFQLPGITIEVAQECSGIRSSYVLFITTLAASYLFLKSPWRRIFLISFVVPLAIVRNGFRIWVIGLLCVEFGPPMIHSVIHHRGGPIFFALSLIPLFLLLWWLRKGETDKADISRFRNADCGNAETPIH